MKPTLLLAIIGVAFAGLFGYHMIHVPQQAQGRLIETQIAQETANQQARADVAALLQEIEHYQKRLPPEPEPSWLARKAVALAEHAGVQLITLRQDAPFYGAEYTRLSISLQLRASYHQVGVFLDRLERAPHYFRVDSLELTRPQDDSDQAAVTMVVSTVYLPPVHAAGGS